MGRRTFNSLTEYILVSSYKRISSFINLHQGNSGILYRKIYFLYKRYSDRETYKSILSFIRANSLVIDVGANIGAFSIHIAKISKAKILAFEPEPENFRQLVTVIDNVNLSERIFPEKIALSDHTGDAKFYLSDLAPTDHKLINTRSSQSITIKTKTLDDFLLNRKEYSTIPISLIKIDVQGAELMVLTGMEQTLINNQFPPILVEYSARDLMAANVRSIDFFQRFKLLGYYPHDIISRARLNTELIINKFTKGYTDLLMIHESK